MTPLRLYIDEDVYGAVTQALRRAGVDVLSTPEASRTGKSDESQLEWATKQGRAIVTFNVADFVRLHAKWLDASRSHHGIVVSSQRTISDMLARLHHLLGSVDQDTMRNRLEFLSDW